MLSSVLAFAFALSASEGFLSPVAFRSVQRHQQQTLSNVLMFGVGGQGSFYDEDPADNMGDGEETGFSGWLQGVSRRRRQHHSSFNNNPIRRQRLEAEEDRESRFVTGDELQNLRKRVLSLRSEWLMAPSISRKREIEQMILRAQQMDAEFIYQVATERAEAAEYAGLHMEATKYRQEAQHARAALPQFNLEGLWVGKYGDHGFELVNVSYTGDTLIATKVTGDQNVPKGEMSFQVDLSPASARDSEEASLGMDDIAVTTADGEYVMGGHQPLEPIELNQEAAEQWGSRYLQRFQGMGQVASEGYRNAQWMEGQLILVGTSYFSFAWLPIGHQVFFGRPSAEMTLKLLRESSSQEETVTPISAQVKHLMRCWEETELLDDEMEVSDGLFVSHDQQDYFTMDGCFE